MRYGRKKGRNVMRNAKHLWALLSIISLPVGVHAQVLAGDSRFPLLNEIRWDMKAEEIKALCESRSALLRSADSMLVFQAKFFAVPTKAKVLIDRTSHLPRMVDVSFESPTEATRDTLIDHFTKSAGKPPFLTTKEKSALIFTIKMEVASWRNEKEMISVMTMMRGSTILAISMLISKATTMPKTSLETTNPKI
jgi:hypothetical protein